MKKLLMIPLLAAPAWLYSCTHHTPTPTIPAPSEVIREAHEALPEPPPKVIITPSQPDMWPQQPKAKKNADKRKTVRPAPKVEEVASTPTVPMVIPPRCLFWIIGEAGCLPPYEWYQAYGYSVPKDVR